MALNAGYASKVRPLLDTIDSLRELFAGSADAVSIPSIAIIGNQSAGKTSVLERLSGIDLPRGEGMVTRCALELRLCLKPESRAFIQGGSIGGKGKGKQIEISEVAVYVTKITDELAPDGSISQETIYLTVEGPTLPDLTLIDLPGIVYHDDTDAERDIKEEIKALYMKHIRESGCIILCALPADLDASTQEAKRWALEVDPKGTRTMVSTGISLSTLHAPALSMKMQQ